MPELDPWESFYVIVGSAAGALIGLQFVVMTLIAERPPLRAAEAGAAFSTPTIVHFSAVLLLSALLRVPWQTATVAAAILIFVGFCGVTYGMIVARRTWKQQAYKADMEDWLCFVGLPIAGYALVALSAFAAFYHIPVALFGFGAATLLLLFIGIHNAWDSVAYLVYYNLRNAEAESQRENVSEKKGP